MVNKKRALRIGALLSILMFLLIPLLSSPVAAAFTLNLGSVWTNNTPAGPIAGGAIGGPPTIFDTAPFNANFVVSYTYIDTNPGPSGSLNWADIIVRWQPGGGGAWSGPVTYSQAPVFLVPGAMAAGTYTTPWLIGYGGKGTNFNVVVKSNCQDLNTMTTATWTSAAVIFTIV